MSSSFETFATAFNDYRPDGPITSLRRIQALYGAIEEAEGSDQESVIAEEFRLYATPGELEGFTTDADEDNRLVTVLVDLTGEEPALFDIDVSPLRPSDVPKLGFSRFPWGRGIDHSITRRGAKSGSSRDTVVTYCTECLWRWTNADGREAAVGRVAADHPDGWIIDSLQTLGMREDVEADIEDALWSQLGADDSPRVVTTVAIRVDPDSLDHEPVDGPDGDVYYPAQLHVLNAAMRARKEEKLAEKNTDVPSRGDGQCLVTGEDTEVFGTAEDPLAFFTVQHAEKFPELKRENAWRAHPVSATAALLIQSGASLVDHCRRTRRGRSVYTIPYYTQMDAMRAKDLRYAIEESHETTESLMAKIQGDLEDEGDEAALADLRYYVIALRNDSGDINVLHEVPDATIQPVRELAEAHMAVLAGSTFHSVAGFSQPDNWEPIAIRTGEDAVIRSVTSGRYAAGTFSRSAEDEPSTDDPNEWLTFALLTGEQVPVLRLFREYVTRLAQERSEDADARISENHLKAQYAQFEALARADRLSPPDEHPELSDPPRMRDTTDPDVPPAEAFLTDDGRIPLTAVREYRLRRFIDERPSLDDDARRGSFLAGVLVGQLGYYQDDDRDMTRTALVQYPAEQMSGHRIERLVPALIDKADQYATDDDHRGTSLFPELEDQLFETLTDATANGWSIPVEDLRFHFAIGQLYGKRARNRAFDLRDEIANEAGIDLTTS